MKKAQFYLFTAIFLLMFAAAIIMTSTTPKKETDKFELITNNFKSEGARAINYGVWNESNLTSFFSGFANEFYSYAKSTDNRFGMVYVFYDKKTVFVSNKLNEDVTVDSFVVASGANLTLNKSDYPRGIVVKAFETNYSLNFSDIGFSAVLASEREEARKIRIIS